MLVRDKGVYIGGLLVASWGPRVNEGSDSVRMAEDAETPQFWTVFQHDAEGNAYAIVDVATMEGAEGAALRIGFQGHPDTVLAMTVGAQDGLRRYPSVDGNEYYDYLQEVVGYACVVDTLVRNSGMSLREVMYLVAVPFGRALAIEIRTGHDVVEEDVISMAREFAAMAIAGSDAYNTPDEDDIANHFMSRFADGNLTPDEAARLIARYGMATPREFVDEMRERMQEKAD